MKISKFYLKQIIKEEMEKIKDPSNPSRQILGIEYHYNVDIPIMNFLLLSTPGQKKYYKDFISLLKKNKIDNVEEARKFLKQLLENNTDLINNVSMQVIQKSLLSHDPQKLKNLGKPYLYMLLKQIPKVINHEGRSRSYGIILDNFFSKKRVSLDNLIINIQIILDPKSNETLEELLSNKYLSDLHFYGQGDRREATDLLRDKTFINSTLKRVSP